MHHKKPDVFFVKIVTSELQSQQQQTRIACYRTPEYTIHKADADQ